MLQDALWLRDLLQERKKQIEPAKIEREREEKNGKKKINNFVSIKALGLSHPKNGE